MRRGALLVVGVAVVLVTACGNGPAIASGDEQNGSPEPTTTVLTATTDRPGAKPLAQPPSLTVRAGDEELTLHPISYCWSSQSKSVCADGFVPKPLPTVTLGAGEELTLEYGIDWEFSLSASRPKDCTSIHLGSLSPGVPLEALGPAGMYRVSIGGDGPQGSAGWRIRVITDSDRPSPPLAMTTHWMPGNIEVIPDTPFSAHIANLFDAPLDVSAHAEVVAANGEAATFPLTAFGNERCWSASLPLESEPDFSAQVLALGAPPYDITVHAVVDGAVLTGEPIRWPQDFMEGSNGSRSVPVHES